MKWLIVFVLLLAGCTVMFIDGDGNDVDIEKTGGELDRKLNLGVDNDDDK